MIPDSLQARQRGNAPAGAILAATLMGMALAAPAARAQAPDAGVQNAMSKVYPALVRIYVVSEASNGGRIVRTGSAGSGAIISPDGYVVTNHHVAGEAVHIVVNLASQEEVRADLVGSDPMTDIAVLKLRVNELRQPGKPLPVAAWADSSTAKPGDTVYALGSPGAMNQSITRGVLANVNMLPPRGQGGMMLDGEDINTEVSWFMHDAQIFGGNSGGPLVNGAGEIIGINQMGTAGLGGAIPANIARRSAEQILKHGEVRRAWVGVELQPRLRSDRQQLKGVLVRSVYLDSPAARAGLKTGDILTRFAGEAVDCELPEELPRVNRVLSQAPIGTPVPVEFIRDGKQHTARVETVLRQRNVMPLQEVKEWGMTARDVSRMAAIRMERSDTRGVIIDSVRPAGPVAEAKPALQAQDLIIALNGKPVRDADALRALTAQASREGGENPTVLATVLRNNRQILSSLTLGKTPAVSPATLVDRAWLPIETQVMTPEIARLLGMQDVAGVRVTHVAEEDGYPIAVGDIITDFNGEPIQARRVDDSGVFAALLRQQPLSGSAELKLLRQGQPMAVSVPLRAAPKGTERLPTYEDTMFEFAARNRNAAETREDRAEVGVRVEKVERGGWASVGGLQVGDVLQTINGRPMTDVAALEKTLREIDARRPRYLVMLVKRGVESHFLELEPHWNDSQSPTHD